MAQKDEEIEEQPQKVQKFQPPAFPRPILSTQDTFDQNTQVENFTEAFSLDRRPLWNVPDVVVSSTKITTIKSSAKVTSAQQAYATQSGFQVSPITNSTSFTVLGSMAQVINATGPVQITFSVVAQTLNANDPANFAVFRDGVQVSQTFSASAGAANTAFNVTGSYTDSPVFGLHVYDLRWAKGTSKLTAVGQQRTLQVLNLRAQ